MLYKRIISLVICLLVFAGTITAAYAKSADGWLKDDPGLLTESDAKALRADIRKTAKQAGVNIAVFVSDLGQHTDDSERREFAEEVYEVNDFALSGGAVIFIMDIDPETLDYYDYIYLAGNGYELYQPHISEIYSDMYDAMDGGGLSAGLSSLVGSLYDLAGGAGMDSEPAQPEKPRFSGVLSDLEMKFSSAQQSELTELLNETAQTIQCNVGVVITDDLQGRSDRQYAENFLDNTFGVGSSSIVILYNDDRSNMSYTDYITANGRGTDLYGNRIDDIFDRVYAGSLGVEKDVYPAMDYYESIVLFCRYLSNHTTPADNGNAYNEGFNISFDSADIDTAAYVFVVPCVFGIIAAVIVTNIVCSTYRKKKPISAAAYLSRDRTKYLLKTDDFVREYTTHVHISSSSSSGGGHRSGGGGHRSGRSGGGGRRR
ncbi:MAG: hypothetical protein ACI4XA_01220 [Oscillospiraceae bacterium]